MISIQCAGAHDVTIEGAMEAAASAQIIDRLELDTIRSYLTGNEFASFLEMCSTQISSYIQSLETARTPADLARMVHSMIGAAGTIGAQKVEVLARHMEAELQSNTGTCRELTTYLIAAWAEAGRALEAHGKSIVVH